VKDQFDLDDLFETKLDELKEDKPAAVVPQKPVVAIADDRHAGSADHAAWTPPQTKRGFGCVVPIVLVTIALAVGFGLGALVGSWRSAGGDVVEPDTDPVSGAYVAIFYNDIDLDKYTKSQSDFIKSAITTGWLDEHNVNWKLIDTEPLDVSNLEKPFQVMAEKHRSKEPWIVIASGKKFASEPIESGEQAMKLLQKWVK
jgi:hypothetical protein